MKNFHGQVGPLYLIEAATVFSPLKKRSYEKLKIEKGHKILDVGCGLGHDAVAMAERAGADGSIIGIDKDAEMLSHASLQLKGSSTGQRVHLIKGCASELPFRDDYFDGCHSERLFMHLADSDSVLAEMIRVIKPGGRIVVTDIDWCSLSIDNPAPLIERALSQYRMSHVLSNGYSGRSLYRQFAQQGLSDLEVEVFPVFCTDIEMFYFIAMQKAVEEQALADRVVTRQELAFWRSELKKAAEANCFYSCANAVMVSATKPAG